MAKGDPAPTIRWFVYGNEIEEGKEGSDGVSVGTRRATNGDVVSHLNITQARTKHGGTYECRAASKVTLLGKRVPTKELLYPTLSYLCTEEL